VGSWAQVNRTAQAWPLLGQYHLAGYRHPVNAGFRLSFAAVGEATPQAAGKPTGGLYRRRAGKLGGGVKQVSVKAYRIVFLVFPVFQRIRMNFLFIFKN
jgi:hypothetical protein